MLHPLVVQRSMKGVMLQRHVTGMDELSGFQKYEPLDRTATRDGHAVLMYATIETLQAWPSACLSIHNA